VATAQPKANWNDPITRRMDQDYAPLHANQTVGEALEWLRQHQPRGRIVYFYVVDEAGELQGVVPTRRLVLSPPGAPVADIMVRQVTRLLARATVREACELFVLHRLLAIPVVDDTNRLVGVVNIDACTQELSRLVESRPVDRLLRPLMRFLHIESASGFVLLACAVAALVLANSPWASAFAELWQIPVRIGFGGFELHKPLLLWINDGLMTLFFFVVGLEIKREFVAGELSELRKAMLPLVAALGGMVVPAGVFLALQWGRPTAVGWGIPMATDIAFVVGFLALLGARVPHGLKVLLLTLAIADDIGATLVIAVGYSTELSLTTLAAGLGGFAVVLLFQWIGVRRVLAYTILGIVIWVFVVKSGVHPTVAGVALGLLTPSRPWLGDRVPFDAVTDVLRNIGALTTDQATRRELVSPLDRLERALHPWVAFGIMPLFALANAGVTWDPGHIGQPLVLAVALGLVLGKPIGIVLFSWVSVKAGIARLPSGINGKVLVGAGCLAGIGFTMSLFIAGLALEGVHLDQAKVGILGGSTVSALLGCALLLLCLKKPPQPGQDRNGPTADEHLPREQHGEVGGVAGQQHQPFPAVNSAPGEQQREQ
jgi:NhaA family Na+:H+ antiporter